jgi:hypothetical protein
MGETIGNRTFYEKELAFGKFFNQARKKGDVGFDSFWYSAKEGFVVYVADYGGEMIVKLRLESSTPEKEFLRKLIPYEALVKKTVKEYHLKISLKAFHKVRGRSKDQTEAFFKKANYSVLVEGEEMKAHVTEVCAERNDRD